MVRTDGWCVEPSPGLPAGSYVLLGDYLFLENITDFTV